MRLPQTPDPRPGQARRWRLWALLCLLVGVTLVTLVFLAREYEEVRSMDALEQEASALGADIRGNLLRNVQTLQSLHTQRPGTEAWEPLAAGLLGQHRELVRLEWRDNQLRLLAARDSPFHPVLFEVAQREQSMADVRQACTNARRINSPAYAPSYFWPIPQGLGLELMELCVPLYNAAQADGFLVATYSLLGMLSEFPNKDSLRSKAVALTEVDGTRLSMYGSITGRRRAMHATHLLDLPGVTMMVRLESPRDAPRLFPNVLTALVSALAVALMAVLGLLGRDMRRRMRVESELAKALAFRNAMEDSLFTGLRARDMDGRITYVNPAFCQMVGLSADQLLGRGTPAPYWPPDLMDEYHQRQAVRLAGMTLPREGFESVFMRPDGSRFPVLIIEAPLVNAQSQQTGWMSAVLDLSEQRRVEELSRASQERLQATARLAMVGEMASLLSHELNQPLAAMSSYASGALNLMQSAQQQALPGTDPELARDLGQAMQRIVEQAERAARVIKSVADLVRRREQVREPVAPQALLDAIMPLVHLQARKLGIRVLATVADGCPPVLCDRTMVEQVLLNLARNGMQAMPEGDPTATSGLRTLTLEVGPVRASPSVAGTKRWVEFAITDHGQGLSDEVAARLFTPFFTTKAEGMGLGLSLCRTVVEQHGGALAHGPAEPRGTVFRFTLPVATSAPRALAGPASAMIAPP
ncbi:two-component system sensor histidine kinase NtrB [Hydrogenophaga sp. OTU3427]|uniref:two-component system sensor histidine kinase NtrB n=1 Tax=Hydrogenophaga sp. OTU3427 TaxID=3043856 RepID=UPI00313D55D5